VEFTVSQTMEHFLACHEHAFAAWGGVPSKIMSNYVPRHIIGVGQNRFGVAAVWRSLVPTSCSMKLWPLR
jgi:hypothetical protein